MRSRPRWRDAAHWARQAWPVLGPCAVVGVGAVAILLAFGVHPPDILRFAAYEAGFTLLPGWLLYLALNSSPPGLLRQVAVGWGLGYVLEILAYAAGSALGVRSWFAAYPVLVILPAAALLWRRRRSQSASRVPPPVTGQEGVPLQGESSDIRHPPPVVSRWVLSAACVLALLYLAVGYFTETPLPGAVASVSYYPDLVWDMGLAAEAMHHWPITDPNVAGTPLSYYTFVFVHLAAISQVTGLALPLVLFRLYAVTFLLLLTVQLYLLGTVLGGTRRAGLLTVLLLLFVGEIDPYAGSQYLFLHVFFPDLYLSPTFLLGLVLFVPLVVELSDLLRTMTVTRKQLGDWLVVGLFLVGCGGAKGTILPVVVGGLGLYLVWKWWSDRQLSLAAMIGFGLALLAFGGFYLLMYGNSGIEPAIRPLSSLYAMEAIGDRLRHIPSGGFARVGWLAYLVVAAFVGLMGIRAVGLAWLAWARKLHFSRVQAWLLCLFLVSLIPFYALGQVGESQLYFFWYGYVAAGALAAHGLDLLAHRIQRRPVLATVVALPLLALLVVGLLDTPLDNKDKIDRWRAGLPTYAQTNRNLTTGLWLGMDWIREHTDPNAVLAVNNYYSSSGQKDARYFYYAAFAERRVFLEGWMYTNETHRLGYARVGAGEVQPFPERADLNQRVFGKADAAALKEMVSRYGVCYVLVDKVHGGSVPSLDQLATLVYTNDDVAIFAVGPKG